MNSLRRSFALLKASRQVFKINSGLMWYPIVSSLSVLVLVAVYSVPFVFDLGGLRHIFMDNLDSNTTPPVFYPIIITFALLVEWVIIFTNSAFYISADAALEGRSVTVKQGIAYAWQHRRLITKWALLTGTVGIVLRMIEERLDVVGSLVVRWIGIAWRLATVFTVPVLIKHEIEPVEAVKHSAQLFKKTWGENVVAGISLSIISSLALTVFFIIPLVATIGFFFTGNISLPVTASISALLFLVAIAISTYFQALQTVFMAALYRFADTGDYVGPYTPDMLQGAYRPKQKGLFKSQPSI